MLRLSHTKMDGGAFMKVWWKYNAISIRVWPLADVRRLYLVCFQTLLRSVRYSKDFQLITIPPIWLERGIINNKIRLMYSYSCSCIAKRPSSLHGCTVHIPDVCALLCSPLCLWAFLLTSWVFILQCDFCLGFFFWVCACVCLLSMFLSVVWRLLPSSLCSGCDCTNRCLLESSSVTSSACTNFLPVALGPVEEPPPRHPPPSPSERTNTCTGSSLSVRAGLWC